MRIWYQSYSGIGFSPRWEKYEEDLKGYIRKISRPDTEVDIHGVEKFTPNLNYSEYIQYMHVQQVIAYALKAELEGYDAFCIGGTLDLGHNYLREVLDIPIAFIAECSFLHACLLARRFGIVSINEGVLRGQMQLIAYHGLEQRCVPSVHIGSSGLKITELFEKEPQRAVDLFAEAARKVIAEGAGAIVPGFGAFSSFLGQQGIHDIDGAPIVDSVAVVIKTAEMLVDLSSRGVKRSRIGYIPKEELLAARKLYGAD